MGVSRELLTKEKNYLCLEMSFFGGGVQEDKSRRLVAPGSKQKGAVGGF